MYKRQDPCIFGERESVIWCYGEKYIKRESIERYCEKKKEIKFFKVNRKYRELVERLGIDMVYENNEYLPYSNNEIEITINDENKGIKYLPVVENYDDNYKMNNQSITYDITEIDGTLLDRDLIRLFDSCLIYEYNVSNNKIYLLDNKINRTKVRLLFNDGG